MSRRDVKLKSKWKLRRLIDRIMEFLAGSTGSRRFSSFSCLNSGCI